jgi:hypothetical protein
MLRKSRVGMQPCETVGQATVGSVESVRLPATAYQMLLTAALWTSSSCPALDLTMSAAGSVEVAGEHGLAG